MEGRARISLCFVSYVVACSLGFNIDTNFPKVFRGEKGSYFGFTVALLTRTREPTALVSAPKATRDDKNGVVYRCNLGSASCTQVLLDKPWDQTKENEYRETYIELKKNMFLGVSLDAINSGSKENIVACGHKWKDKRQGSVYFLNGACYVFDQTLSDNNTKKLLPLNIRNNQFMYKGAVANYYALGMAGFSAAFTEDGAHLLLGAPGVLEGIGSIIDYTMGSRLSRPKYILDPDEVKEERLINDSYIGYSVTSGRFFTDARTSYVAGAPRAENDIGCVFIFEQFSSQSNAIIQEKLIGEQMGEYYGYAILGININGDSYTDLLVGAPFHSKSDIDFDTGRVYVYISDGITLEKQIKNLEGPKKRNARFGTAINSAGDLNMDGYLDIVVGAPYEDGTGAVYVYHGTANGVNPEYVQRIVPSQFKVDLSGFGFSISKAKDIDSNGYSDLLIGAYSSDRAVLLRSHPVIFVQAKMDFNAEQIRVNSSGCEINGVTEPCIEVRYCLSYSGKHIPIMVDMKVKLQTDVQRYINPRTYIFNETLMERKTEIETTVTLYNNQDNCYSQKVYVKKNIDDFITPVSFHLTYDVKNVSTQQFCKSCPVLDKGQINKVVKEVVFWTGCGDDNECNSDLKVQVSLGNEAIIAGERKPMIVEITTKNEGEHAYQAVVHICMQHKINIINMGECSDDNYTSTNPCLKCSIGNPLKSLDSKSIQLKLDPSNLPANLTKFEFSAIANTSSKEINPSDNNITVTVPIISKAGIRILGSSFSEIIYLQPGNQTTEPVFIKHKYTIAKFKPSPISSVKVVLLVPLKLDTEQQGFFQIANLNVDQSMSTGINIHCDEGNPNDALLFKENVVSEKNFPSDNNQDGFDTAIVSCRTAVCHIYRCIIGPFISQEVVSFEIVGFMNITRLQKAVGKRDITIFVTEGVAAIEDGTVIGSISEKTDYTFVTTSFERRDLQRTGKIPLWIIIVSVIAGILLLVILIVVLVKVGFFRRKEKEEMDSMVEDDSLLNKEKPPSTDEEMRLYDDNTRYT